MHDRTEVAIIGAGPYGLSIAAHLNDEGIDHRVYGSPMQMWREGMPAGMLLKSNGSATNLSAPNGGYTLEDHCAVTDQPYAHNGMRMPLQTVVRYGMEFCARHVSDALYNRTITRIERIPAGFELCLDTGERIEAARIVVAIGLKPFAVAPAPLYNVPADKWSHASQHHSLALFVGRRVTVIGGGQSALELAVLLNEAGAEVSLVTRRPLRWFPDEDLMFRRPGPLGPGWRAAFWSHPTLCRLSVPPALLASYAYRTFGPGGSGWLRPRFHGIRVEIGHLQKAHYDRPTMRLDLSNGRQLAADHVIAATGYRVDLRRVDFLDSLINAIDGYHTDSIVPVLSRTFESSLNGLYFAGFASAASFGPAMRFVFGCGYAAPRIARALVARHRHLPLADQRAAPVAGVAGDIGGQLSGV